VNRTLIRLAALLIALCISPASPGMDCSLVVVADSSSSVDKLTAQEVRRIFLGVSHKGSGDTLYPLRNTSDPILEEIFLQKILFMSANSYRRALAGRMVRTRVAGPPAYQDQAELIKHLHEDPRSITYLLATDLPDDGSMKVLLSQPCDMH